MCFSDPKTPPPAAAAPVVQPIEAPKLEIGQEKTRMASRRMGTNSLRIDRTASRPDIGSGLNIPQ